MSARPWHKRYHSDALAGFMPLSLEERGAYQTVLDLIYDHGGPIADDERILAAYMRCSPRKWRAVRDQLVGKGKISFNSEGLITNSRAERELGKDAETSRMHAENGLKGARALHGKAKKPHKNSELWVARPEPSFGFNQKPDPRGHTEYGKSLCSSSRKSRSDDLSLVMEAGGFTTQPSDHHVLEEWLALPDIHLGRDILPVVQRVAESLYSRTGKAPFKLKFFDAAVRQNYAEDAAEIDRMRRIRERSERLDDEQQKERGAA
ncbi:DUF1376 domain-containing protein [Sphingomonas qilianensis]|uniref:DUF1376 domain-containing protein n=1 Tax=Sphingomonas qilianensis TaxID=1736690 RepID=A0ABU9XQT0_9SPHN